MYDNVIDDCIKDCIQIIEEYIVDTYRPVPEGWVSGDTLQNGVHDALRKRPDVVLCFLLCPHTELERGNWRV